MSDTDWKAEARKWEQRAKANAARADAAEARVTALEAAPKHTPPKRSTGALAVIFRAPRPLTTTTTTPDERQP